MHIPSTIYDLSEDEMRNPDIDKYCEDLPDKINCIYDQLKDYIFDWVNNHEIDIKKAAVTEEKIDKEIANISFSKDKLFNYLKTAIDKGYKYDINDEEHDEIFPFLLLRYMGVQTFHNCITREDGTKFDADYIIGYPMYIYAACLLSFISEKLYYFILSEVRNIICGDINSELKPSESLDIPMKLDKETLLFLDDGYEKRELKAIYDKYTTCLDNKKGE